MLSNKCSAPCALHHRSFGAVPAACRQAARSRTHRASPVAHAAAVVPQAAAAAAPQQAEEAVHPVHPVLPAPSQAHFEAGNTVFVEEFRIRGNEAGPDQKANIITIANMLQVGWGGGTEQQRQQLGPGSPGLSMSPAQGLSLFNNSTVHVVFITVNACRKWGATTASRCGAAPRPASRPCRAWTT